MVPKGTAAAVLGSLLLQLGMENGAIVQNLVYGVILISILITAVLIFFQQKGLLVRLSSWFFTGYATNGKR